MSDEELEQDDLDVSDEEEGEELNAADDGDDSLDDEGTDSERATPAKKAKAKAVDPTNCRAWKPSRRSAMRWRGPWKNSSRVAARCRKSNPMWSPTRRRSRIASMAAALSERERITNYEKARLMAGFFVFRLISSSLSCRASRATVLVARPGSGFRRLDGNRATSWLVWD